MNFSEPLQTLVPGATGRVLAVLAQTSLPLSGRAIAGLAGVSAAQATRVLQRLVDLGVVDGLSAPPAILYSLAEDNVAVAPLRALGDLSDGFVEQLAHEVARLEPAPACVGAYGSFARRQAVVGSDIDLLVVRPSGVDEDDDDWAATLDTMRTRAGRLAGNRVELLEVDEADVPGLLRRPRPLWQEILRDFLPIYGPSLQDL